MNKLLCDRCRQGRFSAEGYNIRGSRRRAHDSVAWNTAPPTFCSTSGQHKDRAGQIKRWSWARRAFMQKGIYDERGGGRKKDRTPAGRGQKSFW